MARILLDDPAHAGGSSQLGVGSAANDGTGDPLRTGGQKLKQWAADLNSMTQELYVPAGAYNPGSLLAPLGLFDHLRWHQWFHDFIDEPSGHATTFAAGWQYLPDFKQWSVYSNATGNEIIERNAAVGVSTTYGSWLQVLGGGTAGGDYLILSHNDASGAVNGATALPFTSSTKRYAAGFKVVFSDTTSIFRVGFWDDDTTFSTTLTDGEPGIFVQTAGGVATAYVKNYEFSSPKGAAFPVTITYDVTKAYEFEFLYDGVSAMSGQYRIFTGAVPGSWISLGSVDMSTWQRFPGSFLIEPMIGLKTTTAAVAEIGVDYMILAAER